MKKNTPNNTSTFEEWLEFWFETYKKPMLKPYSLRNIEQVIRIHTPKWLKNMRLQDISIFDIDKALAKIPVSRTYIYTRQVWHSALFKACRAGLIEKNPVDLCERVKYKKKRSSALNLKEQEDFIQKLEQSRYKWLMLFYLHTGVRRTEALTLKWSDIDESENKILIRGTKTADSWRYIPLTDDIKNILDGQRQQIKAEKKTRFKTKNPKMVFDYSPEHVSRMFKDLCPNHHLHDLRHTYITRCAESGINIAVCQSLVGHSNPELTLSVYTHVLTEFKRKEIEKFSINPYQK